MENRIRSLFRGAAISETTVAFLQMPTLSEALIIEGATDAEHVQKLTVVLEIATHAEQDQVLL